MDDFESGDRALGIHADEHVDGRAIADFLGRQIRREEDVTGEFGLGLGTHIARVNRQGTFRRFETARSGKHPAQQLGVDVGQGVRLGERARSKSQQRGNERNLPAPCRRHAASPSQVSSMRASTTATSDSSSLSPSSRRNRYRSICRSALEPFLMISWT